MDEKFTERLAQAMAERGIKDGEALARLVGLHSNTCRAFINGKRIPSGGSLAALTKFLVVDEAWLLGEDAPYFKSRPRESSVEEVVIKLRTANGENLTIMAERVGNEYKTTMSKPDGLILLSFTVIRQSVP